MKANELRLGNKVSFQGEIYKIICLTEDYPFLDTAKFGIGVADYNNIQPIRLNRNHLKDYGFKQIKKRFEHKENVSIEIYLDNEWNYCLSYFGTKIKELNYLHELQNLYYLLMNKEL